MPQIYFPCNTPHFPSKRCCKLICQSACNLKITNCSHFELWDGLKLSILDFQVLRNLLSDSKSCSKMLRNLLFDSKFCSKLIVKLACSTFYIISMKVDLQDNLYYENHKFIPYLALIPSKFNILDISCVKNWYFLSYLYLCTFTHSVSISTMEVDL